MAAMNRASRTGSAVFSTVLFTLATVAPADAAPGSGQSTAAPTWGSCDRFISDAYLPTAQCATVPVPISDADTDGPQAHLAVVKIPATGDRQGVLLINPGGPGASAVDAAVSLSGALSDSPISEHFDLIGFRMISDHRRV